MDMTDKGIVLVTGGSGYVASFCIGQLLNSGWTVRTTVRNLAREADVRATVARLSPHGDRLSVFAAVPSMRRASTGSDWMSFAS